MSKTTAPIKSYNFKPKKENLVIFPANFNQSGGAKIAMHHNGSFICIQTHKMKTPFGFSSGFGDRFDPHVNLCFDDSDKSQAFMEGIRAFEELIIKHCFNKRKELGFYSNNTDSDRATLEDFRSKFRSSIREPKNQRYDPTIMFKFKLSGFKPKENPHIVSTVRNSKNDEITPSPKNIPRFSQIIIVTENPTVWISSKGSFGVNWEIESMKVYPPEPWNGGREEDKTIGDEGEVPTGQMLIEDSDNEE